MFIKNQTFRDEDTLLEMLFDFALGEPSPLIAELKEEIEKDLAANETYQQYKATLTDEEELLELEAEERYIRLAEGLQARFDTFRVNDRKLYGLKGGEQTLLYEVDLV